MTNDNHSFNQARAQYESILELLEDDDSDAILENALEISVRSDWYSPGDPGGAQEYFILLCTGGPAVRIYGELNQYHEPETAQLEHQDWGTPWTKYFDAEEDKLLEYAQYYYFVE